MTHSISNSDDQAATYWERVREIGFALPCCADCGRFHFYPRPACPWCASTRVAPTSASGRGAVYSYSVVHRAPSKAFADQVPYVVAIIETDEGPHLMSRIVGIAPEAVTIGLRVEACFGRGADPALPQFKPDAEDA